MEILLGVLAVAGVLGIFCLAFWRWREYLIGYFVGGGGPAAGADGGSGSSEGGASSQAIDHAIASDDMGHHSADAVGDDY